MYLSVVTWTEAGHIFDGVFPTLSQHMDVVNLHVGFAIGLEENRDFAARNLTSATGPTLRIRDDVWIPIENSRSRRSRSRLTQSAIGQDARLKNIKVCLCFLYRLLKTLLL